MWETAGGSVLSGIVLTIFAHFIARGGRQWRSLAVARHELEIANLLGHAPELAGRVRERAHARVQQYLAPPRTERTAKILSGTAATLAALMVLRVGIGVHNAEGAAGWPTQFIIGGAGAVVWHAVNWRLKPVIHRKLNRRNPFHALSAQQPQTDLAGN